jgi:DNA-binding transcriptional regulator YiaG
MRNLLGRPEELIRAYEACIREVIKNHPDAGPRIKLRFARQFLGMTQHEFAKRIGINPITVRNWEANSRPEPTGPSELFINILAQDPLTVLRLAEQANSKGGDRERVPTDETMEAV